EVGEHPVTVEPHEGEELAEDLQVDQQHGKEPQLVTGEPVERDEAERENQVKINPAEIRAHPRPPAEPVAIGHIGVERGEAEVEAAADLPDLTASVAKRRSVAELVEDARSEEDRQHDEQGPGGIERSADAVGHAVFEVEPRVA